MNSEDRARSLQEPSGHDWDERKAAHQASVDQPWEVIRRAADRLEKVARWADKGPWVNVQGGWCIRSQPSEDRATWRTVASGVGRANSDWIAALSPAVAEPLVVWLRAAAIADTQTSYVDDWHASPAWQFASRILGEQP